MASKANIFSALPQHHSDSEDDDDNFHKNKAKKTNPEKKQDRPKQDNKTSSNRAVGGGNLPQRQEKEEHARHKEARKDKGVSDQPHPLDRHSGTGNAAYGGKPKKGGAGKGNWGGLNDRKAENAEDVEANPEEPQTEAQLQELEKPSLTLQEYYQQQNFGKAEQAVNEAKAKITSEQLLKEMGTATLLKGRHAQEVDDRKAGKKKDRLNVEHHAAINTEHANLLNFRTGFIEKEYKQRGAEGESPKKPTQQRRGKEQENAKEEETQPGTQTEGATQEAQPAVEGGQEAAEGQGQTQGQKGGDNQNRRGGRGGYRGDRQQGGNRPQGERPQGDRPQGDRPQGERRNYGNKQPSQPAKIDLGDDAFPKLG